MITVKVKTGNRFKVEAEGHANTGEKGHDLICAGVSLAINTIALCVKQAYDTGILETEPIIRIGEDGEGTALVKCKPKDKFKSVIQTQWVVLLNMLTLCHAKAPEAVEVIRE